MIDLGALSTSSQPRPPSKSSTLAGEKNGEVVCWSKVCLVFPLRTEDVDVAGFVQEVCTLSRRVSQPKTQQNSTSGP